MGHTNLFFLFFFNRGCALTNKTIFLVSLQIFFIEACLILIGACVCACVCVCVCST